MLGGLPLSLSPSHSSPKKRLQPLRMEWTNGRDETLMSLCYTNGIHFTKNKDGTRISNSIASEKWSTVSNEFYQQPENDSDNHQETWMGGWETTKLV